MNPLYLVLIPMGILVCVAIVFLYMGNHDEQIDRENWNNDIKTTRIDIIENCDEFFSKGLGDKGYWVDRLYTQQLNKYFPDNPEMFDYIENKKMELKC